ncbi:MAG: sugar phosphate isomerase/epimerase [Alteromonadaceae bacterium]|jgi:sugar phosphate isomerase/epimerase
MKIHYHKSFWESDCADKQALEGLLAKVAAEGYQGTELFLPFYPISPADTLSSHKEHGLDIITGIATDGTNVNRHLDSLSRQVEQAMAFSPRFINSHTGRDIFTWAENIRLFEHAMALEAQYGISIVHETHRFRPTFSTFGTEQIINALPTLKLNLDISHWMVVHESDLSDQHQRVQSLLNNVHHVHARVGFEEGPQVTDPQHPRWATHLANHTRLWQNVVDVAAQRGQEVLTITPEFGPFPYAHFDPRSDKSLTDIWAANGFIRQHLADSLVL